MKYLADSLSLFDFHDSYFIMSELSKNELHLEASALNIHKHTKQNPADFDMEICEAKITFTDFNILSYKLIGGELYDYNRNLIAKEDTVIYSDIDAQREFLKQAKKGFDVMGITELSDNVICLTANSTVFQLEFTFSAVKIEWDDYTGKAWYEKM